MLSLVLFAITVIGSIIHSKISQENYAKVLLKYLLFFNVGIMGLLAAYGHIFMGPEIAKQIGWAPGSPFQFEMGMTNLSYGILGILAVFASRGFKAATVIGWSVLLLGCFIGHLQSYYADHNTAPYNFGIFLWLNDLILPILALGLLAYTRFSTPQSSLGSGM